jgi:hypothetical protein
MRHANQETLKRNLTKFSAARQPSPDKKDRNMQGQWIGEFSGTNSGSIIIDVDKIDNSFVCCAYIFDFDTSMPNFVSAFILNEEHVAGGTFEKTLKADLIILPNGERQYNTNFSASTRWLIEENFINIGWLNDGENTRGSATCVKADSDSRSEISSTEITWNDLKENLFSLEYEKYIFRGQSDSQWKLTTSFHRTNRNNLDHYEKNDIVKIHQELSSRTKHLFDLNDPKENAAFYALIQHHGYPTPLQDWSLSPFVASYFAFRNTNKKRVKK